MPGCAAINCSNSAKKGFLMKLFPRNSLRRKEWLIKMRRDHWTPTDYSCLCEIHFAPEMWKNPRVDGKRILKSNAVPTIFSFTQPKSKGKTVSQRKPLCPKKRNLSWALPVILPAPVEEASTSNANFNVDLPTSLQSSPSKSTGEDSEARSSPFLQEILPNKEVAELQEKLNRYKKLFLKKKNKCVQYKKLFRSIRNELMKVEKGSRCELVKQLFNSAQISTLHKKKTEKNYNIYRVNHFCC